MLLINTAIFVISLGCCYCIGCIFMWFYCHWLKKIKWKQERSTERMRVVVFDQNMTDDQEQSHGIEEV